MVSEAFEFTNRVKKPLYKKLNPIWWFQNDNEQTVEEAPWYHPEWSQARRYIYWNFFRNPLQNFRCFVVGVEDRNYIVVGKPPVLTVQRDDLQPPETGWQWSVIKTFIPLGFVSYAGNRFVFYVGWQPTGIFGTKLNFKGA